MLEIVKKYPNITQRAIRKIENAVQEMSVLFYKNGEINYETLLDTLALIKRKGEDDKFSSTIDIYIENI